MAAFLAFHSMRPIPACASLTLARHPAQELHLSQAVVGVELERRRMEGVEAEVKAQGRPAAGAAEGKADRCP